MRRRNLQREGHASGVAAFAAGPSGAVALMRRGGRGE